MGESSPDTPPSERPPEDRLDSWKEIAAYLGRDMTTVQRWEKREGMPVHRHLHDSDGLGIRVRGRNWTRGRAAEIFEQRKSREREQYLSAEFPCAASAARVLDLS